MVQSAPRQHPSSAPAPRMHRAWRLWAAAWHSQAEAPPSGAQPLSRVLELAASIAADSTTSDPAGKANKAWGGCCMMRAADLHPALPDGVMHHWRNSGYSDDWIITQVHPLGYCTPYRC